MSHAMHDLIVSPASFYPKTRSEKKIEQLIVATGKHILSFNNERKLSANLLRLKQ